jgi:uncharacterized repeat protein (TIGR02543 family)
MTDMSNTKNCSFRGFLRIILSPPGRLLSSFLLVVLFALGLFVAACDNPAGGGGSDLSPTPGTSYTITFDSQGGSEVAPITAKKGTKVEQPTPPPEKDAFYFDGWFDQEADGEEYKWEHTLNADVTMYAYWTDIPTYTISFKNHGDSSIEDITAQEGTKVDKPEPQKDYFSFNGWFSEEDGGEEYETWPHTLTENIDMYAQWTPIQYTITYHLDGGTNNVDNPETYTVESETIVLKNPTKYSPFGFRGWYDHDNFWYDSSNPITEIPAGSTGDKIFYVFWYEEP